ncbi:MAG: DUF4440 domain-containing protein, partial [Bacteroidia bacterium]
MKTYLNIFLISILLQSCISFDFDKTDETQVKTTILAQMKEQEDCWNNGNLECFMKHYWQNDSLEFIGKSGLNLGWQTTLDNYKNSYKNKDEMGVLSFEYLKTKLIDHNTFHVIGKWKLERETIGDTLQGHFSLLWQQKNEQWV